MASNGPTVRGWLQIMDVNAIYKASAAEKDARLFWHASGYVCAWEAGARVEG